MSNEAYILYVCSHADQQELCTWSAFEVSTFKISYWALEDLVVEEDFLRQSLMTTPKLLSRRAKKYAK